MCSTGTTAALFSPGNIDCIQLQAVGKVFLRLLGFYGDLELEPNDDGTHMDCIRNTLFKEEGFKVQSSNVYKLSVQISSTQHYELFAYISAMARI